MALQIRRGTNAERLGITLVEGEVVYVTDFELVTIEVTSVNASTNTLTTTLNHGLAVNDQIKYQGTTSNGLTEGTVYFVKAIPSQTDFTLSTTQGGTILDITGSAASLVFAVGPKDAVGVPYGYSISPLYVGDGVTAGGNPAGSSVLNDLYDVTIGVYGNVGQYGQALANNNVIQYNDVTDQWENRADLTLNGVAYINGDNVYINYDGTAVDSRIYFQGTTAEIKYDTTDARFEVNKDIIANGLQGGNVQVGIGNDNEVKVGSNNLELNTDSGYYVQVQRDLVVGGDLTVNGTTTTVNSTTLTVDDKNIELAATASPNNTTADGGGITLKGATDKKIIWNNSNSRWSIDNGDSTQYVIPINIDDLNDVVITGTPASGEFLFHNGTNWINDNKVTSLTAATRAVFEYKPTSPSGITSSAFLRKDFAANTYANGDGVGIGFQLDSNSQNSGNPLQIAFIGAIYDSTPAITLRTSTDSFATNSVEVAKFDNDVARLHGLELILNANNAGAASDVQIKVERGTTGADAYIKWDEDATTPQWFIGQQTQIDGRLAVNGSFFTEAGGDVFIDGTQLVLNNANIGATSSIVVARSGGSDVAIRWNETSDRWETTVNGSTYIELPNQDLDTDASPTFAGLTGGNIRVGVTGDNEIDTSTGGLTLDSAGGTVTVDDDLVVNDNLQVNGSTTLGNASGDLLTVNATATFQPNVTFNNDIDVKGGQIQNSTGGLEIISTGANNLVINPGSGTTLNDGHMILGQLNIDAILTTNGTGDLSIRTGSYPTSANITLNDGANGDITVDTDGTGQVLLNANVSVQGDLTITGDTIKKSSGTDVITFSGTNLTTFAGDIKLGGNTIYDSAGNNALDFKSFSSIYGTSYQAKFNTSVNYGVSCAYLFLDNIVEMNTSSLTTTATTTAVLDYFDPTAYRSAKYIIQITNGSSHQMWEGMMIHDGTDIFISAYGDLRTGANLATVTAAFNVSTGYPELLVTPVNATQTKFKATKTYIAV